MSRRCIKHRWVFSQDRSAKTTLRVDKIKASLVDWKRNIQISQRRWVFLRAKTYLYFKEFMFFFAVAGGIMFENFEPYSESSVYILELWASLYLYHNVKNWETEGKVLSDFFFFVTLQSTKASTVYECTFASIKSVVSVRVTHEYHLSLVWVASRFYPSHCEFLHRLQLMSVTLF